MLRQSYVLAFLPPLPLEGWPKLSSMSSQDCPVLLASTSPFTVWPCRHWAAFPLAGICRPSSPEITSSSKWPGFLHCANLYK
jgi:hypothetical protein